MANYNNNDRSKGGYFDQYVNFDQFLMQHNINNWSPSRGPPSGNAGFGPSAGTTSNTFQTYNGVGSSNSGNQHHGGTFYFHPQSANSNAVFSPPPLAQPSSNWVQNSNLTATATEFIPQQTPAVANNSALAATASEFVPRKQKSDAKQKHAGESKPTVSLATAAAAAAASFSLASPNFDSSASCDKSKGDSASNQTESVIQALSNTHISDGKALNSSGGAIKKVRSQDYRNDSRDRHPNGELFPRLAKY